MSSARVCLATMPTATEYLHKQVAEAPAVRDIATEPSLGVLTLAGGLLARGVPVDVVDMNQAYYAHLDEAGCGYGFAEQAAARLARSPADIFGLSTICSSYPLTLRLAGALRALRPQAVIVLGGPQASVVAKPTLEAFPAVDLVVRGEADHTFPALVDRLLAGRDPSDLPGLTHRARGGIVETGPAPLVDDMDALPLPAYHLVAAGMRWTDMPLEVGRGCPYACTFCSTNTYFSRRFRLKSPEVVLAHMRALHERYGVTHFGFTHDMFTVSRKKVLAYCDMFEGSGFTWGCSARTDRVDPELLRRFRDAGCTGVFYGVETGSVSLQRSLKKHLDLEQARAHIQAADDLRIDSEVSLISGFPDETLDDLRDTVDLLAWSLALPTVSANIGLLAPLAGTPIEHTYRDQLVFPEVLPDMSFQGWHQDDADLDLIHAHPRIFPNFYAVPTKHVPRRLFATAREFTTRARATMRWLMVGLHQDSGDLLEVMQTWPAWRGEPVDLRPRRDGPSWFGGPAFVPEFLRFVDEHWIPARANAKAALHALVRYERAFGVGRTSFEPDLLPGGGTGPAVAGPTTVCPVQLDFGDLKRRLHARGDLLTVPDTPCVLASHRALARPSKVVQLTPLLGALLQRCDGRSAPELEASLSDLMPRQVAEVLVRRGVPVLAEQGLLRQTYP